MRPRIPDTLQRLRPTPARRRGARPQRPERAGCVPLAAEPSAPETRVRAAGGPEDNAHYTCSCGLVFTAAVSASVACPHCGTGQDW